MCLVSYIFYIIIFRRDEGAAYCIRFSRLFRREHREAAYCVRVVFLFFRRESLDELPIAFAPSVFFRRDEGAAYCIRCSRFFRRDEGAAYCIRFSRFFFSGDIQPLMADPNFSLGF